MKNRTTNIRKIVIKGRLNSYRKTDMVSHSIMIKRDERRQLFLPVQRQVSPVLLVDHSSSVSGLFLVQALIWSCSIHPNRMLLFNALIGLPFYTWHWVWVKHLHVHLHSCTHAHAHIDFFFSPANSFWFTSFTHVYPVVAWFKPAWSHVSVCPSSNSNWFPEARTRVGVQATTNARCHSV